MAEEMFRDDELQDRVPQKFQTLIIEILALGLVAQAGMRQRLRQEERVVEFVLDSFLQGIHGRQLYAVGARFSRERRTAGDLLSIAVENGDRRHQIERALQNRIVHQGFLGSAVLSLR